LVFFLFYIALIVEPGYHQIPPEDLTAVMGAEVGLITAELTTGI